MYVPAVVAVGYWFEKRRSLVTGTEDYACAVLLASCWKISGHRYRRLGMRSTVSKLLEDFWSQVQKIAHAQCC
jgi:hypothetical protein